MKKGVFCPPLNFIRHGGQFKKMNPSQIPGMRRGDRVQFLRSFRQGDVKAAFTQFCAFQQKLKRQGGFAHAGVAPDQIETIAWQAAAENTIQSLDSHGAK